MAETLIEISGHVTLGPPKTRNGRRTVPLLRSVISELEAHLTDHAADQNDSFVFSVPEGGPLRRGLFRTRAVAPDGQGRRPPETPLPPPPPHLRGAVGRRRCGLQGGQRPGRYSSVAFTLDRYGHLFEDDEDTLSSGWTLSCRSPRRPAAGGYSERRRVPGAPRAPRMPHPHTRLCWSKGWTLPESNR